MAKQKRIFIFLWVTAYSLLPLKSYSQSSTQQLETRDRQSFDTQFWHDPQAEISQLRRELDQLGWTQRQIFRALERRVTPWEINVAFSDDGLRIYFATLEHILWVMSRPSPPSSYRALRFLVADFNGWKLRQTVANHIFKRVMEVMDELVALGPFDVSHIEPPGLMSQNRSQRILNWLRYNNSQSRWEKIKNALFENYEADGLGRSEGFLIRETHEEVMRKIEQQTGAELGGLERENLQKLIQLIVSEVGLENPEHLQVMINLNKLHIHSVGIKELYRLIDESFVTRMRRSGLSTENLPPSALEFTATPTPTPDEARIPKRDLQTLRLENLKPVEQELWNLYRTSDGFVSAVTLNGSVRRDQYPTSVLIPGVAAALADPQAPFSQDPRVQALLGESRNISSTEQAEELFRLWLLFDFELDVGQPTANEESAFLKRLFELSEPLMEYEASTDITEEEIKMTTAHLAAEIVNEITRFESEIFEQTDRIASLPDETFVFEVMRQSLLVLLKRNDSIFGQHAAWLKGEAQRPITKNEQSLYFEILANFYAQAVISGNWETAYQKLSKDQKKHLSEFWGLASHSGSELLQAWHFESSSSPSAEKPDGQPEKKMSVATKSSNADQVKTNTPRESLPRLSREEMVSRLRATGTQFERIATSQEESQNATGMSLIIQWVDDSLAKAQLDLPAHQREVLYRIASQLVMLHMAGIVQPEDHKYWFQTSGKNAKPVPFDRELHFKPLVQAGIFSHNFEDVRPLPDSIRQTFGIGELSGICQKLLKKLSD